MKFFITTALLVGFISNAFGAGYQLRYQGAETMGTNFSSATSHGDSLSSIYYNPGLFLSQGKDKAMAAELMILHPFKAEFTSQTGTTYDDFQKTTFSGGFFFGYKVDDETALTVALTTPWGTSSDYDPNWDGRFMAIKTDLAAINLQPILTKSVSDKWILSVGPQIQYMTGKLTKASPPVGPLPALTEAAFEGDNLSVGGVFAATYKASEKTSFGFNYTSRVKHNLKGDFKAAPVNPVVQSSDNAEAELVTPDVFTLGVTHAMSESLLGHFAVSYTNWSVFKSLDLKAENVIMGASPLATSTPQNWDDTYMVSLGATFISSEKMTFRGGLAYETGAVDNKFRTPRTIDTDRISLGLGTSIDLGSMNLDIAYNHIFYTGDVELQQPALGGVGTYDASAGLLRAGLEWTF